MRVNKMHSTGRSAVTLLLFLFLRSSRPSGLGKCPKYEYLKTFDLSKFSGHWYEVERSFYMMEIAASCITMELKENDKGHLEVTIKTKGKLPFRRTLCEGIASATKKHPSLLLLKISSGLPYGLSNILPGAGIYQVLETDYDNYAVLMKCTTYGFLHMDSIWIFGRRKEIDATLRADIYSLLTLRKIDTERLIIPRNINCTY